MLPAKQRGRLGPRFSPQEAHQPIDSTFGGQRHRGFRGRGCLCGLRGGLDPRSHHDHQLNQPLMLCRGQVRRVDALAIELQARLTVRLAGEFKPALTGHRATGGNDAGDGGCFSRAAVVVRRFLLLAPLVTLTSALKQAKEIAKEHRAEGNSDQGDEADFHVSHSLAVRADMRAALPHEEPFDLRTADRTGLAGAIVTRESGSESRPRGTPSRCWRRCGVCPLSGSDEWPREGASPGAPSTSLHGQADAASPDAAPHRCRCCQVRQ